MSCKRTLPVLPILFLLVIAGLVASHPGLLALGVSPERGPQPPELVEPLDDARFGPEDLPPILTWTADDEITAFELELGADPDFELTLDPILVTDPSFDLDELIPGALWGDWSFTLYWRVRAADTATLAVGPWSAGRVFHKSALGTTRVVEPGADARYGDGDDLPRLEWKPIIGAAYYQLEFGLDEEFVDSLARMDLTNPVLDMSGTGASAWQGYAGVFYWRVAGVNAQDIPGPWGPSWMFAKSVGAPPAPQEPDLEAAYPPRSDVPNFRWLPVEDAVRYELQIALDDEFTGAGTVVLDDPEFLLDELVSYDEWSQLWGTFWWRVAVTREDGIPGSWSHPRRFTKLGLHRFLAWGDSITEGECVYDGYIPTIRPHLQAIYPDAVIENRGIGGAKAIIAGERMEEMLRDACPEFVFMLFGANDCVDEGNCDPPGHCDVDGHLGTAVDICQDFGAIPILSTLVPINPDSDFAWAQYRASLWSQKIRAMRTTYGVEVAETEQAFLAYPDLPELYCEEANPDDIDWVHPNELGYQILSDAFMTVLYRVLPD